MKRIYWIIILGFILTLHSCVFNENPDMTKIEKKLGLQIPPNNVKDRHSEALGFDYMERFSFEFEQSNFTILCANLEETLLFNFCKSDSFSLLSTDEKLASIKKLQDAQLTGYWLRKNNGYEFFHPTLTLNHFDTAEVKRAMSSIILDNENLSIVDTMDLNRFPYIIFSIHPKYNVSATIDITKRTLKYKLTYL